jgi:hypothetical protein
MSKVSFKSVEIGTKICINYGTEIVTITDKNKLGVTYEGKVSSGWIGKDTFKEYVKTGNIVKVYSVKVS